MTWVDRVCLVLLSGLLIHAPSALAQDAGIDAPIPDGEVFDVATYTESARRDPFLALTTEAWREATGPRFEELSLTGVFQGSAQTSLVLIEDSYRTGHFIHIGEQIGDARLVEILPEAAVFDVMEFGVVRREVLRLERPEEMP